MSKKLKNEKMKQKMKQKALTVIKAIHGFAGHTFPEVEGHHEASENQQEWKQNRDGHLQSFVSIFLFLYFYTSSSYFWILMSTKVRAVLIMNISILQCEA